MTILGERMGVRRKPQETKTSTKKKTLAFAKLRAASSPPSKAALFRRSEEIESQADQQRDYLVAALHDRHFRRVPLADLAYAVRCFISDGKAEPYDERGLRERDVRALAQVIAARFDFTAAREPLDDYSLSEAVEVLAEAHNVWLAREDAARRD